MEAKRAVDIQVRKYSDFVMVPVF